MKSRRSLWFAVACLQIAAPAFPAERVEFCLDGEFDLGARYQGMHPEPGEFSDATWCVITESDTGRVRFQGRGRSNPDMTGEFVVSFLPPDVVRIVNESAADLEFTPADIANEAMRYRRIDPKRLVAELDRHPEWIDSGNADGSITMNYPGSSVAATLHIVDGKLMAVSTTADLPLRGTVPVEWRWRWPSPEAPEMTLAVDGDVLFRATGRWRALTAAEAATLWQPGDEGVREIPGDAWPARIAMRLETLADGVYLVRNVRTGFHHLVAETDEGLVVGDAPAGWVELPQIPPADLVPGFGISGLSERFVDFLAEALPGRPLQAVALTHAHDDHAGGARAFAAAGATIYAPAAVAAFLESALNRDSMPNDRLSEIGRSLQVEPVDDRVVLDDQRSVELVSIGAGPHVSTSLGLLAGDYFFQSDLHVVSNVTDAPPAARARTECWFAGWAIVHLDPDTVVVGSHANVATPVSKLENYADSDACQKSVATEPGTETGY